MRSLIELDRIEERLRSEAPDSEGRQSLEIQVSAVRARLSPRASWLYGSASRAGRRPAVVPLERGSCTGCHMRIPSGLAGELRQGSTLSPCPFCRRVLYFAELLPA